MIAPKRPAKTERSTGNEKFRRHPEPAAGLAAGHRLPKCRSGPLVPVGGQEYGRGLPLQGNEGLARAVSGPGPLDHGSGAPLLRFTACGPCTNRASAHVTVRSG